MLRGEGLENRMAQRNESEWRKLEGESPKEKGKQGERMSVKGVICD